MTQWLFWGCPLITSAYAVYEVRRSPDLRGLGYAVVVSGVFFAFLFAFEPTTIATHVMSTIDSVENAVGFWPAARIFRSGVVLGDMVAEVLIRFIALVLHFALLAVLMYRAGPDVPDRQA